MHTGYRLLRLTVSNTTAHDVQCILRKILLTEGPAKDRAIKSVALYMTGKETNYDECFDMPEVECMEPSTIDLRGATVEVSYG